MANYFWQYRQEKLDPLWKVRQFAASVGRSVLLSFGGAADRLAWMRRESARGYERCLRQRLYFPTVSDVELGL